MAGASSRAVPRVPRRGVRRSSSTILPPNMVMGRADWQASSRPLLFIAVSLAMLGIALLSFQWTPQMLDLRQECSMAYMHPTYVVHDAQLRAFSSSRSPVMQKYSLREYREMNATPSLTTKDRTMHASPVLFIPGNAGSFAQVRSMAASASDQFWAKYFDKPNEEFADAPGPVNWFTIDFNEDFSAFHGQTLRDQAFFVNEVVRYLRELYPLSSSEGNATVPLVGHSMGGLVARLVRHLPNYVPASVDTIVTLSTPHAFPPVPFDRTINDVYMQLERPIEGPEPLLISIAGGLLDTQLSSDASSLTLGGIHAPMSRLSTFTTSVSALWSSTDHLAIVWCDQLRFKIARGMLRDYKHYGRVYEARNTPSVQGQRREFWRHLLGIPLDAAAADDKAVAIAAASEGPTSSIYLDRHFLHTDLAKYEPELLNRIHVPDINVAVFKALAPPGPRQTYTGQVTESDEALAFELVTNLAIGANPDVGHVVSQINEIFVTVCSRKPAVEVEQGEIEPAWCYPILNTAFDLLPWSVPPQEEPQRAPFFPEARYHYDHPSISLHRLYLSHEFLRAHHVETVRVEYTRRPAQHPSAFNVSTVLEMGWTENKPFVLRGAPSWFKSTTWDLPGVNVLDLLSSFEEHAPLWEWDLPDMDSSLLAYTLTLEPAPCAARLNPPPPHTPPMVRVLSQSTGDSRLFPSLDVFHTNTLPVALHGPAPFMPVPSHHGWRFQLWLLDTYRHTVFSSTYNERCPLPFTTLRASVHWRASLGLLVLRYRLALLVFPLGFLALARWQPGTPWHALTSTVLGPGMAYALGTAILLHVFLHLGGALGAPKHALGIGTTSFQFLWIGPVLLVLAAALALTMCAITTGGLALWYALVRRYMPSLVTPGVAPEPLTTLPTRLAWTQWLTRRRTWISIATLLTLLIFLPYQILIVLAAMVHAATTAQSYMAYHEARRRTPADPRLVELLQESYTHNAWLLQFLVWFVPLHAPVLVVWIRNVNAGFSMGAARTEHNAFAVLPLVGLMYLYAAPWSFTRPTESVFTVGTRVMYGLLALCALIYGIRYSYMVYESFVLVLLWEIAQLVWPLYHPAPVFESIQLDDVSHLQVPPAVEASSQIDTLLETYLATLDAYLQARDQLTESLQAGFVQLTRAKMSLEGTFGQRVGRDAYDERMSAQIRVAMDAAIPSAPTTSSPKTEGLRRRHGTPQQTDNEPKEREIPTPEAQGFDPLYQFSGLPPRSLKAAQRHFQQATSILVQKDGETTAWKTIYELQQSLHALEQQIEACRSM